MRACTPLLLQGSHLVVPQASEQRCTAVALAAGFAVSCSMMHALIATLATNRVRGRAHGRLRSVATGVARPDRGERSGFSRMHRSRTKKFSTAGKVPCVSGWPCTGALSRNTCTLQAGMSHCAWHMELPARLQATCRWSCHAALLKL